MNRYHRHVSFHNFHSYHNTAWHHNGWFWHGGYGWRGGFGWYGGGFYPGWRNYYYWGGGPWVRWNGTGIGTWGVDYTNPNPGLTYNWPPQYYLYADPTQQVNSPWPPGYQLSGGVALQQALAKEQAKSGAKPTQQKN